MIRQLRGTSQKPALPLVFSIEDPERVRREPLAACFRQLLGVRLQITSQRFPIGRPRLRTAKRVDAEPRVCDAKLTIYGDHQRDHLGVGAGIIGAENFAPELDRKSTRLNSSHVAISYAVFCLKKKT